MKKLQECGTVGDLLWQPMSAEGPIDMDRIDLASRANTLVELQDLATLIGHNVRVMLVLGPCTQCLSPHGKLLDAILGARPRLVTDVVTDVSNVQNLVRQRGEAG